MRNPTFST